MDAFSTCIKTRKQASPTSAGNRNTNVISSWLFSSRLPRITTQQWRWTAQPPTVGTERGDRGLSGGEPNAPTVAYSSSETWNEVICIQSIKSNNNTLTTNRKDL